MELAKFYVEVNQDADIAQFLVKKAEGAGFIVTNGAKGKIPYNYYGNYGGQFGISNDKVTFEDYEKWTFGEVIEYFNDCKNKISNTDFKAGDIVKCIKVCGSGSLPMEPGDIVMVRNVSGERLNLTDIFSTPGIVSYGSPADRFVLATGEETKDAKKPKDIIIGDYPVHFNDGYITVGCKRYTKTDIDTLDRIFSEHGSDSYISLRGIRINADTIGRIELRLREKS